MHCPNCHFQDWVKLCEVLLKLEEQTQESSDKKKEKPIRLIVAMCKVCGTVFVPNFKDTWD